MVKLKNHAQNKFQFKFLGPFYIVDKGPNDTFYLQRPDGRRWVDLTGTDTPVNPEYLHRYSEFDGENYYDGRTTHEVSDGKAIKH